MLQYTVESFTPNSYVRGLIHGPNGVPYVYDNCYPSQYKNGTHILPNCSSVATFRPGRFSPDNRKVFWGKVGEPVSNDKILLRMGGERYLPPNNLPIATAGAYVDLYPGFRYEGYCTVGYMESRSSPERGKWVYGSPERSEVGLVYVGPRGGLFVCPKMVANHSEEFSIDEPTTLLLGERILRKSFGGVLYALDTVSPGKLVLYSLSPVSEEPGIQRISVPTTSHVVQDFDVRPDGKLLALVMQGRLDHHLQLYDIVRNSCVLRVQYDVPSAFVSFAPDGLTLAILGSRRLQDPVDTFTRIDLE